ncbi:MAG: hypothetical protein JKY81_03795 [Colwellia sp.]|nr:hypothetical protein [Colwellia sp.]
MKFNSTFFSTLLITNLLLLVISANAWAGKAQVEKEKKPERWFEIEVILFKQLGDKTILKEQFPDHINAVNLPHYQQSFDLLTPYLQPDLTNIKKFVPLCGEQGKPDESDEQSQFLGSLQRVSSPFTEQMKLIEQVALFTLPNLMEKAQSPDEVEQTEEIVLEFDLQKETLAKAIFSTKNICVVSQSDFERLFEQQLADVNLDSFDVEALPKKLNASGAHVSDSPYLIADESLLLKDINQRLRWSKEFSPLLHFGWRQVGITKKKAIAVKLFAGKHLDYDYQQVLATYQNKLTEADATTQISSQILSQIIDTNDALPTSHETDLSTLDNKLNEQARQKQQALNQLFASLNQAGNMVINDTIKDINRQTLDDILSVNKTKITQDEQASTIINFPKEPLQPWFLDGFFKVHLDHFLYITTDFNVFNQNLIGADIGKSKKANAKLINFSQNRRVITGEIHYFDHPYIGMIVQIRRFDPTKPANEAISQVIK